jgi:hypothetical protein
VCRRYSAFGEREAGESRLQHHLRNMTQNGWEIPQYGL